MSSESKTIVSDKLSIFELITPIISSQESKTSEFNMTTGSTTNLNNWLQSLHSAEPTNVTATEIVAFDLVRGNILRKIPLLSRTIMLTSTGERAYLTFDHFQLRDQDIDTTNMMDLRLNLENHLDFTVKWFALASFFKQYTLPYTRITTGSIIIAVNFTSELVTAFARELVREASRPVTPGKLYRFEIELVVGNGGQYVKFIACA